MKMKTFFFKSLILSLAYIPRFYLAVFFNGEDVTSHPLFKRQYLLLTIIALQFCVEFCPPFGIFDALLVNGTILTGISMASDGVNFMLTIGLS